MCLYPKLITNPKYKKNAKNGGVIPLPQDSRITQVPIGCGDCIECRKKKARDWQVRLLEDVKEYTNGKFVTLTFRTEALRKLYKLSPNQKGYDLDNATATKSVRLFLERYRKKYKKSIRHWLITELGSKNTEHVHIHGILWTDVDLNEIERIWQYGWMWKGKETNGKIENWVNARTVNYIIKYVTKADEKHKGYKAIILTSAGIGKNYTKTDDYTKNKYNGEDTRETYRTANGFKIALPIYYRNKIYTEEEREKLWINKIDKGERWIMGEKINIKETEKDYNETLKYYQKLNIEKGYRDKENWTEEKYERERRIMKQKERLTRKIKEENKKENKTIEKTRKINRKQEKEIRKKIKEKLRRGKSKDIGC